MTVREGGDPRLEELFGVDSAAAGVRPVVRLPRQGLSGWVIALLAGVGAILLFALLDSRRSIQPQPAVREGAASQPLFSPEPPPLYIPPASLSPAQVSGPTTAPQAPPAAGAQRDNRPSPFPSAISAPRPYSTPAPITEPLAPAVPPSRAAAGPALVIDTTAPASGGPGKPASDAAGGIPGVSPMWGGRVQASGLANRSDTVAQGTLIPAVLETAFNSTSPGLARAIVSRDVRGFDGTKVLIPRGSRLIGEYGSNVASGQKRALITWTRLIRPDGMMIVLDSPATDTLGRGGVDAHVNSHFLERFLSAILRTSVDIGGAVATRAAAGSVIIAGPGLLQGSGTVVQSDRIVPTLSIPPGKSISIFAARDLEFPAEKQQ